MKKLVKGLLLGSAAVALVSCSSTNNILATNNHHQDNVTHNELPLVLSSTRYKATTWFATNKATLNAHGKSALNKLVATYQQLVASDSISANTPVQVVGHTDSRASASYNQGLSERRAAAVAAYLKSRGIATVVTRGASEYEPVASNRTRRGMQKNRRAEIHIGGGYIRVVSW